MSGVSKITVSEQVSMITFNRIPASSKLIADIFSRFAQAGVIIDMISQTAPTGGAISISFTCSDSDLIQVLTITKELSANYSELRPLVRNGNCKIQLYGEEMRQMHGVFARAVEVVADRNANLRLITTSEVDISLLVSSEYIEDVLPALYDQFGLSPSPRE